MRKILIIIMLLLIPINVLAYSNYIIPGGKTLGIEVVNDGILIVGFYKISGSYNRNDLKVGDIITMVNNIPIESISELVDTIEKEVEGNIVNLTIRRGTRTNNIPFELVKDNDRYKTGLYVKDSITGIGTLTYIDPSTMIYGALGHEIIEGSTGRLIEVKTGKIFRSSVTKIDKSAAGTAGTKNARFHSATIFGDVRKNTNKGIYGIYTADVSNYSTLEVGRPNSLEKGPATIYTVTSGEEVKEYNIEINNINYNAAIKNIQFRIISEELINQTGGIVQGMSGSPIIQNNRIYGAVTHVILDNPISGYGIFITTMLEEGER